MKARTRARKYQKLFRHDRVPLNSLYSVYDNGQVFDVLHKSVSIQLVHTIAYSVRTYDTLLF